VKAPPDACIDSKVFGRLVLIFWLLFLSSHRLPAPIVEEEKPTPAPEQSVKPKPKRTVKPNIATENAQSSEKRKTISGPQNRATPARTSFAGTWSGTMNITLFGNIGYTFLIDPAQTTVKMWGTNNPAEIPRTKFDLCPASISPDGISWNWSAWKWTLKPYPDGKTALVKVAGPFQSGSAIFRRE
jgi:hypothetical protein